MALLFEKRIKKQEHNSPDSEQATMLLENSQVKEQPEKGKQQTEDEFVEMEIKPAHIICPDCGGITIEGLDYCHRCGGELKPTE